MEVVWYCELFRGTWDDKGATALAPKMDMVVCAHKFFHTKESEADFASDYTAPTKYYLEMQF